MFAALRALSSFVPDAVMSVSAIFPSFAIGFESVMVEDHLSALAMSCSAEIRFAMLPDWCIDGLEDGSCVAEI